MASVDGLVSGIDVSSIVSQLIQVDGATQRRLKANVTSAQSEIKGYQSVNTKMAALQTAAEALSKAGGWTPTTATSSSTNVAVSSSATADQGSIGITVNRLASTRSVLSTAGVTKDQVVDPSTFTLPVDVLRDGKKVGTLAPVQGTISEIAEQINKAADLGVKAVAVRVGSGEYRLQLTSTTPGKAGAFELVAPTNAAPGTVPASSTNVEAGAWDVLSAGEDAELYLGDAAVPVYSATNTFADIIPGVTITAQKADPGTRVTIASGRDSGKVAEAMAALVEAANAALAEIGTQSKAGVVGTDGKLTGGGALNGDSTLRGLQSQIMNAVTSALGGGASASSLGVQSTRDGRITFAKDKFLAAYEADPRSVQNLVAPTTTPRPDGTDPATADTRVGLAERLRSVAKLATAASTGSLSAAVDGRNASIKDLNNRIEDWDDRLAAKKARYQSYYARLETALGSLQTQSTWLSGQLSGLNSNR
ncbi:flagellar filament capping protein FliD [Kineococcus sp. R8]|uniref:flagellar filament capping protein FliD n=1 Tax=Kineococcus siccus TaxID=2696567 RepID=UPI0014135EFA|nr:flagellar filament capping protein FliD [Kineococcus siccus]NAZ81466.1 flagellar filament capping protein FliD [Kineococcus siccus]